MVTSSTRHEHSICKQIFHSIVKIFIKQSLVLKSIVVVVVIVCTPRSVVVQNTFTSSIRLPLFIYSLHIFTEYGLGYAWNPQTVTVNSGDTVRVRNISCYFSFRPKLVVFFHNVTL